MNHNRFVYFVNLPVCDYRRAWRLQTNLASARKDGRIGDDVVLWLEHFPIFTLGRRGGRENLKVSDAFLEKQNISVVPVERGGNITYHAPGQLIAYPIIDLGAARLSIPDYVCRLEEVMIRTAADYGVRAERNPLNRGVWVGGKKLGSVGIAIRRGISFHGLALNVEICLHPFEWINPCGLEHVGVTSLGKECGRRIDMAAARDRAQRHMEKVLHLKSSSISLLNLERLIQGQPR